MNRTFKAAVAALMRRRAEPLPLEIPPRVTARCKPMRSILFPALVTIACSVSAFSQVSLGAVDHAKQARIELVSEFIRELEVLYRLQETAKTELAQETSSQGKLVTAIRVGLTCH
jgi:hypothetical protein